VPTNTLVWVLVNTLVWVFLVTLIWVLTDTLVWVLFSTLCHLFAKVTYMSDNRAGTGDYFPAIFVWADTARGNSLSLQEFATECKEKCRAMHVYH